MSAPVRILIVETDFYPHIAEALRAGAVAALDRAGAEVSRITVPGVLEAPAALAMAITTGRFDGYVVLGCVIRGETSHYDIVAGESARAIMDLSVAHRLAVGNGILTVENERQARARAQPDGKDKGGDAARAALTLIEVRRRLAQEAT